MKVCVPSITCQLVRSAALLTTKISSAIDPRVRVFHQENLAELEQWLSQYCGHPIQLPHHNPARRARPALTEAEWTELEQQVRWLYAADSQVLGYAN